MSFEFDVHVILADLLEPTVVSGISVPIIHDSAAGHSDQSDYATRMSQRVGPCNIRTRTVAADYTALDFVCVTRRPRRP